MAYYGADSAIERSLLTLGRREAWFEWTSGRWVWGIATGALSDSLSVNWLGYYNDNTSLLREIKSRAVNNQLPWSWNNQVSAEFFSGFVPNSNLWILSYNQLLKIPLWADTTSSAGAYRNDSQYASFNGSALSIRFFLNNSTYAKFSEDWGSASLCDTAANCDFDGDNVLDDSIVSRQRNGKYLDSLSSIQDFSIVPRSLVGFLSWALYPTVFGDDETIRMSSVNDMFFDNTMKLEFTDNFNPLYDTIRPSERDSHLVIWWGQTNSWYPIVTTNFKDLLSLSDTSHNSLEFSLQWLLRTADETIYPFLQWTASWEWGNGYLSQSYFKIIGTSTVGEYSVTMEYRRPVDGDYLWSFTAIF